MKAHGSIIQTGGSTRQSMGVAGAVLSVASREKAGESFVG